MIQIPFYDNKVMTQVFAGDDLAKLKREIPPAYRDKL